MSPLMFIGLVVVLAVVIIALTRSIDTHGVLAGIVVYGTIIVGLIIGVYEGSRWLWDHVRVTWIGG